MTTPSFPDRLPRDDGDAAAAPSFDAGRRALLVSAVAGACAAACARIPVAGAPTPAGPGTALDRVRPGDPGWPSAADWAALGTTLGGRLRPLRSPFDVRGPADEAVRAEALRRLDNPFFVGDEPGLTQTSGWQDAWVSRPAAWVVTATGAADVAAAVDFARRRRLRLVVRGGGHSYQGTSQSPDALMVWTRRMNDVQLHDAFVPRGGQGRVAPVPAVTLGAGATWSDAYHAVTTVAGRYVQGGGCTSVGVAGLVQSGGFGSFSKRYGTAASSLLEAEVVTADGRVRIVNAFQDADLFWALKGGGGGSFGVVTRLTLRTHELPETVGGVFGRVRATTDEAWRELVLRVMRLYRDALANPHWGEQIVFRGGRRLGVSMVFQGLTAEEAFQAWAPLVDWIRQREDLVVEEALHPGSLPARHLWDAAWQRDHHVDAQRMDDRPGAPAHHAWWKGDGEQVGWFIHGYHSAWMPAALLAEERLGGLVDAIVECCRHWGVGFHFNKGLAGAPAEALAAARDTATNPQVLDAFALAIVAGGGAPAFPGMPGAPRDEAHARDEAAAIARAAAALGRVAPGAGAYVSESDYFQPGWERAFWGSNAARLARVKQAVDPEGLFFVRHGVGSQAWSEDGFVRRGANA